jgi:type III pantothenate kinase
MLLTIDIGNTNITLGVFGVRNGTVQATPQRIWRLATRKAQTSDEYGPKLLDLFRCASLDPRALKGVAVASVVPALDATFAAVSREYLGREAFFVTNDHSSPIRNLYDNPEEVGADRIANAAAAFTLFRGPAIIIDFGTATTFDCVGGKGEYLGGAIAPGPRISAESLVQRTAKLPRVEITHPSRAIGKSTAASIQSGLYFGYIGLIKEILQRIKGEMRGKPLVIATGGLAGLIVPEIREVKEIVPELTLEGIRILWERNRKG